MPAQSYLLSQCKLTTTQQQTSKQANKQTNKQQKQLFGGYVVDYLGWSLYDANIVATIAAVFILFFWCIYFFAIRNKTNLFPSETEHKEEQNQVEPVEEQKQVNEE